MNKDLQPESNDWHGSFISRFLADPSMQAKYPSSHLLRHAAERVWTSRPGAPTLRSDWEKQRQRLVMQRERRYLDTQ